MALLLVGVFLRVEQENQVGHRLAVLVNDLSIDGHFFRRGLLAAAPREEAGRKEENDPEGAASVVVHVEPPLTSRRP